MCGRMTHYYTWAEIHEHYRTFTEALNLPARYNVAPTQDILTIVREGEGNAARMARWWLTPAWAGEPIKATTFNTRTEAIETSKLWKPSLERWRCIVPASGWYEFTGAKGAKQPWHFTKPDGGLLSFAGLWAPNDKIAPGARSCSIIITEANDQCRRHHDRMPVILEGDQVERWLAEPDVSLLRPYTGDIVIRPANTAVNKSTNNGGAEMLVPDGPVEPPQGAFHD